MRPHPSARYVAIITDGNGRWARARGLTVNEGHEAGADTVKARLRDAAELGIQELTVYSFSTENWSRSPEEVNGLMAMFSRRIAGETPELHEEGVRMRFIGRRDGLSQELREQMRLGAGDDRRTTSASRCSSPSTTAGARRSSTPPPALPPHAPRIRRAAGTPSRPPSRPARRNSARAYTPPRCTIPT